MVSSSSSSLLYYEYGILRGFYIRLERATWAGKNPNEIFLPVWCAVAAICEAVVLVVFAFRILFWFREKEMNFKWRLVRKRGKEKNTKFMYFSGWKGRRRQREMK